MTKTERSHYTLVTNCPSLSRTKGFPWMRGLQWSNVGSLGKSEEVGSPPAYRVWIVWLHPQHFLRLPYQNALLVKYFIFIKIMLQEEVFILQIQGFDIPFHTKNMYNHRIILKNMYTTSDFLLLVSPKITQNFICMILFLCQVLEMFAFCILIQKHFIALAQLVGHLSIHQNVTGLILIQATCRGCGLDPQ